MAPMTRHGPDEPVSSHLLGVQNPRPSRFCPTLRPARHRSFRIPPETEMQSNYFRSPDLPSDSPDRPERPTSSFRALLARKAASSLYDRICLARSNGSGACVLYLLIERQQL